MAVPSLATGGLSDISDRERAAAISSRGDLARAAAIVEAQNLEANKAEEIAARVAGDIRGTGTLTQFRPKGGWRTGETGVTGAKTGEGLRAVAETAELGAPTSFNAGAGAPDSIAVMRGNRTTFAPPRQPGQQFVEGEYSGPLRAAQAFNRAAGVGEFEPLEGPKMRLAASLENKQPLQMAQSNLIREKQLGDLLGEKLRKAYGVEDKEKGLVLPPGIERLRLGFRPKSEEDVDNIMRQIAPEAQKVQTIGKYNDPKQGLAMRSRILNALPDADENLKKYIKETPVTPDNISWFEEQLGRAPKVTVPSASTPGAAPSGDLLKRIAEVNRQTDQGVRAGEMSPGTAFWKKNLVVPMGEAARSIAETGIEAGQAMNRGLRSVVPGAEKVISPRGNYLRWWE